MSAYLEGHIRNNSDRYHSNRSLKSIDDVIEKYLTKLSYGRKRSFVRHENANIANLQKAASRKMLNVL